MAAPSRRSAAARLTLLTFALVAAVLIVRQLGWFDAERLPGYVEQLRGIRAHPIAAPLFVLVYAIATVLALPGSILTLVGGAVFGFGTGLLLNWSGALLGALGAFLAGRRIGGDSLHTLLGGRGAQLGRVVAVHGFWSVLRLRLIPIVPFNALNYGAALAGVRTRDYLLATAVGIIPGAAIYTWFADALVAGAAEARRAAFTQAAVAGALLILLSFLPALTRRLGLLGSQPQQPLEHGHVTQNRDKG